MEYFSNNAKRTTLPSVNHESRNYKSSVEMKSPKRRLNRKRSERLIGNYASDSRHPFFRQPSISEELPNNSNTTFISDKQNNNNHINMVPEWLRKNPLQLHYINNCERSKNNLKSSSQFEICENSEDDCNSTIRNQTGIR